MFKFIHAADIHLDSPLRGLASYEGAPADRIRGAAREALEELTRVAIDEEVHFVVIAGDVFDGDWRDYNTGLFFAGRMSRLREKGIRVFLLAGNHDAASSITKKLRMPDNVRKFPTGKPRTFMMKEIRVAIHGQGFAQPDVSENLAVGYPDAREGYYNIGVLHTACDGRKGHAPYAPCKIDDLKRKNYDYWALGHIHKREVLAESPWIVYPGNIQGRHARETGDKGCSLVVVEDHGETRVEHRILDAIRWARLTVDVAGVESGDGVARAVREALEEERERAGGRMLAVRIEITGACPAHDELSREQEKWVNQIRMDVADASQGDIWVEKVKLNTAMAVDLKKLEADGGPVGGLLSFIRKIEKDPALLSELADGLAPLKSKLPAELLSGDDAIDLESPDRIREILADAERMLLPRLVAR